jgi:transposase
LSCDGLGNGTEFILSPGQASDSPRLPRFLTLLNPEFVLGDKGFDSDENLEAVRATGAVPVIPPKSNRMNPQECDYEIYKERRHIECLIGKLKYFRRIFSRFDKYASHFLSFIHFATTLQWLK